MPQRGCPSQAELEEELRSRIPARWLRGAEARRFEVRIQHEAEGGFAGRLLVHAPGRAPQAREIRAATCTEVSTAIAVFIAIALDPTTEEDAASSAPAPASPAGPRKPAAIPPLRIAMPAWSWSSGFELMHLRMPAAAWGGRVYGELARASAPRKVVPALRISWGWSDFSVLAPRAGETKFRSRTARIEGCARFPFAPFVIAPCAALDLGVLDGTTPELPRVGQASTRWTSAAALVRAGWALVPWLSVDVHAGLLVPLDRTAFTLVDPVRHVYRPPPVLFEGGVGACVTARFH